MVSGGPAEECECVFVFVCVCFWTWEITNYILACTGRHKSEILACLTPLLLFLCWQPLAFFRQKQEKWTWTPNLPDYNPWPVWDCSPAPLGHSFLRIESQSELERRWQISEECINLISPEEKRWIFLIAPKPKSNQTVISCNQTHTSVPRLVLAGLLYRVCLNGHNLWCIQTSLVYFYAALITLFTKWLLLMRFHCGAAI